MTESPVVITGATGWLGSRLALALAQGLPDVPAMKNGNPERIIRCLVQPYSNQSLLENLPGRIEAMEGDITNPPSLERLFDGLVEPVIYHCAGVIHPRIWSREFYAVNIEGTHNVLDAAIKAKASRFIHVSSNSPLGFNRVPGEVFDETSPYKPYQNYGRSKKLAEDLVNAAGREKKVAVVIARAPWFYGPGQPARQTRFYKMIKEGKAPITGSGQNQRSMVYVDNLCQGLILCEQIQKSAGQTYWFADREPYTMNQIIDCIEMVMEKKCGLQVVHRRRRLPGFVSEIASGADTLLQSVGFYSQDIHVLSELNKNIVCSIAKAQRELGYDPKIDLEEGITRSLNWMIDKGIEI